MLILSKKGVHNYGHPFFISKRLLLLTINSDKCSVWSEMERTS